MSRLDEIRARLKAATPAPWKLDDGNWQVEREENRSFVCDLRDTPGEDPRFACEVHAYDNGELIAHAPEDIAWLLAKCERYREALREIDDSMLTGQQAREVAREVLSEEGDG
jgi:hypothetical protein